MISSSTLKTRTALLVLALAGACAPEDELPDDDVIGVTEQPLRGGVQLFASINGTSVSGLGSTVPATVTVIPTGTGQYKVALHGVAPALPIPAGQGGTVQVVATGTTPSRCTIESAWTYDGTTISVPVICRVPGGGAINSPFTIYYGRGAGSVGDSAYATVSAAGALSATLSYNSTGGANSVSHPATGVYSVAMPGPATLSNAAVQVTAISKSSHCHPIRREFIGSEIVTVGCFNDSGLPADTGFTLNYAGTTSVSLLGKGAFAQVRSDGELEESYTHNVCPLGWTISKRIGVGRYRLFHTKVGSTPNTFLVHAFGNSAAHCKLQSASFSSATSDIQAEVACYAASGLPMDSGFVSTLEAYKGTCGACPDCQGGSCSLGLCSPVTVSTGGAPRSVAANASDVFWTNLGALGAANQTLLSAPRTGGAATALVSIFTAPQADSLTLSATHAYWTQAGSGGVYRAPLAGGPRETVSPDPSGLGIVQPRALALVGSDLFWASAGTSNVFKVAGGVRTSLLEPPPSGEPFWYPFALTTDSVNAYFMRDNGLKLRSIPLATAVPSLPTTLSELSAPAAVGYPTVALATNGVHVYFATSRIAGNIYKVPVAGGATTIFATVPGVINGMAINNGTLYWTVSTTGTVMSKSLGSGPLVTRASGQNTPNSIFVDDTTIFWTNADSVRKVAH